MKQPFLIATAIVLMETVATIAISQIFWEGGLVSALASLLLTYLITGLITISLLWWGFLTGRLKKVSNFQE